MAGVVKGVGGLVKTLISGPKVPGLEEVKTAPTPDDPTARRARERRTQRKHAGAGRAGTLLSEESKLG